MASRRAFSRMSEESDRMHHNTTSKRSDEGLAQTSPLRDGGILAYDATFFSAAEADRLFDTLLRETAWKQEMGRGRPFPRLTAWYADDGLIYRYSGVTHVGAGWT